jgi:F0F1-type ATP synthase membrane subunit b/b'
MAKQLQSTLAHQSKSKLKEMQDGAPEMRDEAKEELSDTLEQRYRELELSVGMA